MKRIIIWLLLTAGLILGAVMINDNQQLINQEDIAKLTKDPIPKIKSDQEEKDVLPLFDGDLFEFVGEEADTLIDKLGEPERKDMSAYGYTWWVYTDGKTKYVQFGVEDDKVKTLFATGDHIATEPLKMGASYEEINDGFEFKDEVTYYDGFEFYKFLLNESNMETEPLIKISDEVFAQCYFDTFTNELSSIRMLTGEILLKQRMYEMEYRGKLPKKLTFEDTDWEKIEEGMERQIFDLTNVYRHRFDVSPVIQDEEASEVAFLHSQDMNENQYFSHYTEDGEGLKERLEEENIYYLSAGENIAAQHTDGPAAMEGWLNSEGHREALLNEEYTHLGVGISHLYYTQNFLSKP